MTDVLGLEGAHFLVTGGLGNLGSHITAELLKNGAEVTATSRQEETVEAARNGELPAALKDLDSIQLQRFEAVQYKPDCAQSTSGLRSALPDSLQGIVHCAGANNPAEKIPAGGSPFSVPSEIILKTMLDNVAPIIQTFEAVGPLLLRSEWSSSIILGSMAGIRPLQGIFGYSMAKAALHNYTAGLATMLAQHNGSTSHRVNTIAFGFTESDQNRDKLRHPDGSLKPRAHAIMSMHPAGQMGVPEDICGPALYLLSPKLSPGVTGTIQAVDRGFSANSLPNYKDQE